MVDQSAVPRPVLIVAIALTTLLAAGVAALGVLNGNGVLSGENHDHAAHQRTNRQGPLALPPVVAPKATTPECSAVLAALPNELVVQGHPLPRRPLAQPAPPATVAWGDPQHDPVIVRCGLQHPPELQPTSPLADISGVNWLDRPTAGAISWVAVDRPVFVELTMPADAGTGPVQDLSAILGKTLPRQDVFPR